MISSASEEATRAGLAVLRDGGNAVDAAGDRFALGWPVVAKIIVGDYSPRSLHLSDDQLCGWSTVESICTAIGDTLKCSGKIGLAEDCTGCGGL